MAKTKQQKVEIVQKLEESLKSATSAVFVGFSGLSALDETAMRRDLREKGVGYTVAKKTLIGRALQGAGHTDEVNLQGEVALAYTQEADSTVAARLIHEFGKKWAGKLSILGGIFEGRVIDAAKMSEIATIPGMDALRGMFANIINSPRQRFAVVLSKVAETKN